MENNETDQGKKESGEQIKKDLDQQLRDLKLKLKKQKEALEKFLTHLQPLQTDIDEKNDDQ